MEANLGECVYPMLLTPRIHTVWYPPTSKISKTLTLNLNFFLHEIMYATVDK